MNKLDQESDMSIYSSSFGSDINVSQSSENQSIDDTK